MNSELSLTIRSYHLNIFNKDKVQNLIEYYSCIFLISKVNINFVLFKNHVAKTYILIGIAVKFNCYIGFCDVGNTGIKLQTLPWLMFWLGFIVIFCDIIFTEESIRKCYIHRGVFTGLCGRMNEYNRLNMRVIQDR